MTKHMGMMPVLALATLLAAPVATMVRAEGETADTVMATVNGTTITLGQMIALRETLPEQYQSMPDDALFKGIMDQLVQQEVLLQSVTDLSPRDTATMQNDTRGYMSGVAIQSIVETVVTDEALQAAYDARFKDAPKVTEYNASHILVKTVEEAEKLKADLAAGADFAELAKANSIDTGSGAAGGALGWFGPGVMVKPFEDAVLAAKVGEVTAPIQTDFGFHLILVTETRTAANPPLDQIRDELATEIEDKAIQAKLEELQKSATITREGEGLDPTILNNSALID